MELAAWWEENETEVASGKGSGSSRIRQRTVSASDSAIVGRGQRTGAGAPGSVDSRDLVVEVLERTAVGGEVGAAVLTTMDEGGG